MKQQVFLFSSISFLIFSCCTLYSSLPPSSIKNEEKPSHQKKRSTAEEKPKPTVYVAPSPMVFSFVPEETKKETKKSQALPKDAHIVFVEDGVGRSNNIYNTSAIPPTHMGQQFDMGFPSLRDPEYADALLAERARQKAEERAKREEREQERRETINKIKEVTSREEFHRFPRYAQESYEGRQVDEELSKKSGQQFLQILREKYGTRDTLPRASLSQGIPEVKSADIKERKREVPKKELVPSISSHSSYSELTPKPHTQASHSLVSTTSQETALHKQQEKASRGTQKSLMVEKESTLPTRAVPQETKSSILSLPVTPSPKSTPLKGTIRSLEETAQDTTLPKPLNQTLQTHSVPSRKTQEAAKTPPIEKSATEIQKPLMVEKESAPPPRALPKEAKSPAPSLSVTPSLKPNSTSKGATLSLQEIAQDSVLTPKEPDLSIEPKQLSDITMTGKPQIELTSKSLSQASQVYAVPSTKMQEGATQKQQEKAPRGTQKPLMVERETAPPILATSEETKSSALSLSITPSPKSAPISKGIALSLQETAKESSLTSGPGFPAEPKQVSGTTGKPQQVKIATGDSQAHAFPMASTLLSDTAKQNVRKEKLEGSKSHQKAAKEPSIILRETKEKQVQELSSKTLSIAQQESLMKKEIPVSPEQLLLNFMTTEHKMSNEASNALPPSLQIMLSSFEHKREVTLPLPEQSTSSVLSPVPSLGAEPHIPVPLASLVPAQSASLSQEDKDMPSSEQSKSSILLQIPLPLAAPKTQISLLSSASTQSSSPSQEVNNVHFKPVLQPEVTRRLRESLSKNKTRTSSNSSITHTATTYAKNFVHDVATDVIRQGTSMLISGIADFIKDVIKGTPTQTSSSEGYQSQPRSRPLPTTISSSEVETLQQRSDDIRVIAQRSRLTEQRLQRIKAAYFTNPNMPIISQLAHAWNRVYQNDFDANDIALLKRALVKLAVYEKQHSQIIHQAGPSNLHTADAAPSMQQGDNESFVDNNSFVELLAQEAVALETPSTTVEQAPIQRMEVEQEVVSEGEIVPLTTNARDFSKVLQVNIARFEHTFANPEQRQMQNALNSVFNKSSEIYAKGNNELDKPVAFIIGNVTGMAIDFNHAQDTSSLGRSLEVCYNIAHYAINSGKSLVTESLKSLAAELETSLKIAKFAVGFGKSFTVERMKSIVSDLQTVGRIVGNPGAVAESLMLAAKGLGKLVSASFKILSSIITDSEARTQVVKDGTTAFYSLLDTATKTIEDIRNTDAYTLGEKSGALASHLIDLKKGFQATAQCIKLANQQLRPFVKKCIQKAFKKNLSKGPFKVELVSGIPSNARRLWDPQGDTEKVYLPKEITKVPTLKPSPATKVSTEDSLRIPGPSKTSTQLTGERVEELISESKEKVSPEVLLENRPEELNKKEEVIHSVSCLSETERKHIDEVLDRGQEKVEQLRGVLARSSTVSHSNDIRKSIERGIKTTEEATLKEAAALEEFYIKQKQTPPTTTSFEKALDEQNFPEYSKNTEIKIIRKLKEAQPTFEQATQKATLRSLERAKRARDISTMGFNQEGLSLRSSDTRIEVINNEGKVVELYKKLKTEEWCKYMIPYNSQLSTYDNRRLAEMWAIKQYDIIRNRDDIEKIAHNTGLPLHWIERVKKHVFFDEHKQMRRGGIIARFDPNAELASAWERLYQDNFIANDIRLLEHEYLESRLEKLYKTSYNEAHKRLDDEYSWDYPEYME